MAGIVGDENEVFGERMSGNLCIHLADGRSLAPEQGGDLAVNISRRRVPGHDGQILQQQVNAGAALVVGGHQLLSVAQFGAGDGGNGNVLRLQGQAHAPMQAGMDALEKVADDVGVEQVALHGWRPGAGSGSAHSSNGLRGAAIARSGMKSSVKGASSIIWNSF